MNFRSPDIENKGVFYTDSNGLEMQQRVLNRRTSYDVSIAEGAEVAANYYPVTSAIVIRDETKGLQMTVANSQSQGGSAIKEGRIELM